MNRKHNYPTDSEITERLHAWHLNAIEPGYDTNGYSTLGYTWYDTVSVLVHDLAKYTNLTPEKVACVLSAFSPRCQWDRAVMLATLFLCGKLNADGVKGQGVLERSRTNAERVLRDGFDGFGPDAHKTRAFAHNLLGDLNWVTIDSWILKAIEWPTDGRSMTPKQYERISSLLTAVAYELKLPPARLQSIIWVAVRGRS